MMETRASYSLTWQSPVFIICNWSIGMPTLDVMVTSTFLPFLTSAFIKLLLEAGKALWSLKELCFGAWNWEACHWLWGNSTSWRNKTWVADLFWAWLGATLQLGNLVKSRGPASVSSSSKHKEGLGPILNAYNLNIVNVASPILH